uniref:Uncharacterized protein n=1 Tax=Spongospora subterranea TaxID=70186 RepID=A0A0H5QQQ8_9EUKA|eukprot:CRZ03947.1 hypothetical protein [Spongospora subterranea]
MILIQRLTPCIHRSNRVASNAQRPDIRSESVGPRPHPEHFLHLVKRYHPHTEAWLRVVRICGYLLFSLSIVVWTGVIHAAHARRRGFIIQASKTSRQEIMYSALFTVIGITATILPLMAVVINLKYPDSKHRLVARLRVTALVILLLFLISSLYSSCSTVSGMNYGRSLTSFMMVAATFMIIVVNVSLIILGDLPLPRTNTPLFDMGPLSSSPSRDRRYTF